MINIQRIITRCNGFEIGIQSEKMEIAMLGKKSDIGQCQYKGCGKGGLKVIQNW